MIWKFLREPVQFVQDTSSAISAIAENTKDQLKEQRYRKLADARPVVAPQPEPLRFEPPPKPVETKDKGFVADVIEYVGNKIMPKEKPKPDVTEGRSFVPGQILSEEESDWLAAWHEYEKESRKPGHDQRMALGISKSQGTDWDFVKAHDPQYASHLLTVAAQLHRDGYTDATFLRQKMDERVNQLKRSGY